MSDAEQTERKARKKRENPTTDAILVIEAMERLNMNQKQLAEALGYSSGGAVSGWIKAGVMPLVAARALEALYAQAIKPPGQAIPAPTQAHSYPWKELRLNTPVTERLLSGYKPKPQTAIGGKAVHPEHIIATFDKGSAWKHPTLDVPQPTTAEEDMDAHQATKFLAALGMRVGAKTLQNARQRGNGPVYRKVYNRAIYKRSDLIAWANAPRPPRKAKTAPANGQTITMNGKTYRLVPQ